MISNIITINKESDNYFDLAITGMFSLRDFCIPPENYASFLRNGSAQFKDFIIHYHEATSIEEAFKNFRKKERERTIAQRERAIEGLMKHRDMSEEEARSMAYSVGYSKKDKLFVETLFGRIRYFRNLHEVYKEKKQRTIIHGRKSKYSELILTDNNGEYENLEEKIEYFGSYLDRLNPDRNGKIRGEFGNITIHDLQLQFNFRSRDSEFDSSIELYNRDKGTFYGDGNSEFPECFVAPAIKTNVSMRFMLNSHIDPLIKLADRLEMLVKNNYVVDYTRYSVECEEQPTKPGDKGPYLIGMRVEE